ncbi:MAG: AAA family ATPase [Chthoniobacteraceae bacterium]
MNDLFSQLADAKTKLPLDALMRHLGYGDQYLKPSCKSPFRPEKTASWGVFRTEKGELKFKDFATGETGDQIDFLSSHLGCSTREAMGTFLEMAGLSPTPPRHLPAQRQPPPPTSEPEPEPPALNPFDWQVCVDALTPDKIAAVAHWRGYSADFVAWLKAKELLGIYQDCPATPVVKDGAVIGCQYRTAEGPRYANATPGAKTPALPFIIGAPDAPVFLAMESPWDGLAILECLGMHKGGDLGLVCLAMTRSASNHAKLAPLLEARAKSSAPDDVILVGQNDPPRADGKPTGHDTLEAGVRKLCAEVGLTPKVATPPKTVNEKPIKDVNDWVRADPSVDIVAFLEAAKASTKSKLSIRSVSELLAFQHTDADNFLGDRILAESQPATILGPGGVGKSRLLLQLALCMITGREFLGIATRAPRRPWLILQTENSNRRLQTDLRGMIKGLSLSPAEIEMLNENLFVHTVETDQDAFLTMENPGEFAAVQTLITDLNPAFVVFDPLNTFTAADLNSDADMRSLCTAITRAVKRGNPKRVPLVLHHSLTGRAGAQKATGWDKASYGRNSKVLQAWTRSQINIVPRDPDDPAKLLIACGKNNNGQMFPEIPICFDEETRIYVVDAQYDPQQFREAVGIERKAKGRPSKKPRPEEIVKLLDEASVPLAKLKETVCEKFDIARTAAYYAILEAKNAGLITISRCGKFDYCSRVS